MRIIAYILELLTLNSELFMVEVVYYFPVWETRTLYGKSMNNLYNLTFTS